MTRTLLLVLVGGTILLLALRSLRAGRLKERYVLLFALTGLPFLGLAAWPDAVGLLARLLDIDYRTVLVLALTVFFILVTFQLLSLISVLERRQATLAQTLAMLEARLGASGGGSERALPGAAQTRADAAVADTSNVERRA